MVWQKFRTARNNVGTIIKIDDSSKEEKTKCRNRKTEYNKTVFNTKKCNGRQARQHEYKRKADRGTIL